MTDKRRELLEILDDALRELIPELGAAPLSAAHMWSPVLDRLLAELREPAPEMISAGVAGEPEEGELTEQPGTPQNARAYVRAEWRAMIDAIGKGE